MRLEFHKQVAADISRIMDYYEDVAGPQLADEFYSELRSFFKKSSQNSGSLRHSRARSQARESRKFPVPFLVSHRR